MILLKKYNSLSILMLFTSFAHIQSFVTIKKKKIIDPRNDLMNNKICEYIMGLIAC